MSGRIVPSVAPQDPGKSHAIQILNAEEFQRAIAMAGSYDLFMRVLTLEKHPPGTYLQLGLGECAGVKLRTRVERFYEHFPKLTEYRQQARARLCLTAA